MPGQTFAGLADLYLEATGRTPAAQREKLIHLTEGYRRVAEALDIPELTQPDARVTIPADPLVVGDFLDYVEVDCDLSAIRSVFNVTDGIPVDLEDGDSRGRDRYLLSGALPPKGQVTHALRMGNRLYVRDRPRVETELKVIFRVQVPEVTEADLGDHPLVPAQFQMSIFDEAVASYFSVHTEVNEGGFKSFAPVREHQELAARRLGLAHDPKGFEDRAKRGSFRLTGHRFAGGGGR